MKDLWTSLSEQSKPIVLYGMGNGADKIADELERRGMEVAAYFASDDFVRGQLFRGKRVMKYAEVKELYPDKTIWCYTGYNYEMDILAGRLGDHEITDAMIHLIDVLVDGPFVESKKDLRLRFKGSSNQRIIDVPKSLEQDEIVLWDAVIPE